jgi:hypothetical protein
MKLKWAGSQQLGFLESILTVSEPSEGLASWQHVQLYALVASEGIASGM